MKQTTRRNIRRWTGLMLAICIFGLMLPIGALADEPFYGVYTGGIEDNSHDADHEPLGDLVLPADFSDIKDDVYIYAALNLVYPDEEGGGKVSIKTGDVKTEINKVDKKEYYSDDEDDYWINECSVYGVYASMRDESTLDLETGKMDTAGQAVGISMEDESYLKLNITDTINSDDGGIHINAYNNSDVDLFTKDIVTNTTGLDLKGNDYDDFRVKIDGNITAGQGEDKTGCGIQIQLDDDSTVNILVEGNVKTDGYESQGEGIHVTNGFYTPPVYGMDDELQNPEHYSHGDTTIYVKGDIEAGGAGVYLQNNHGEVKVTVGERDDEGRIISGGDVTSNGNGDPYAIYDDGVFIKTDAKSTTEFSAKDITSYEGKGMVAESQGEESNVNVTVRDIDSWGGDGLYAAAWDEGSKTTIQAGDVFGTDIGVNLCVDNFNSYIHDANGTIDANVGDVQGHYGGLYANVQNGNITVSAEDVQSRDNSGVDISLTGDDKEKGITATVKGDIKAGESGINVGSSTHFYYLEDEYGDYVENPDGSYISMYENPDNYADVTVKGTINAGVYGIKTRNEGGDFTIKAENGVSVSHEKEDNPREDLTINGVYAEAKAGKTTITIDKGLEVFGYQHQGGWKAAPEDYDEVDDDEEDNWYDNSEHVFNGDGVTVQNKGGELDITVNGGLSAVDGTAVIMDVPF